MKLPIPRHHKSELEERLRQKILNTRQCGNFDILVYFRILKMARKAFSQRLFCAIVKFPFGVELFQSIGFDNKNEGF